ncbi:MAG: diacylglycerol kinase [Oscillospiraceae bacterium]|jgi:diacylglycerol kinase (ATP)|nr:diacylglycerol kinase [Oscillospiraceae bacterium]
MKSFFYALCGVWRSVRGERHMRIHLAAVYYVVAAAIFFNVRERWAWAALALACGLVIGAEAVNSALERLCDVAEPNRSPAVGAVKDIAAGAVLVCAVAAAGVAAAVFWGQSWPPDWLSRPAFWAGIAGAPLWVWFVFLGGRKGD